jgi:ankyrin repeat protein
MQGVSYLRACTVVWRLIVTAYLALHAAVMARATDNDDSTERIEMVLSKYPQALDRRTKEGVTALHLALSLRRIPAALYLIQVGADQTLRDNLGRNVLHFILNPRDGRKFRSQHALKEMLDLIDRRLIKSMFLERCSVEPTALTPLASWLNQSIGIYDKNRLPDLLNTILDYSGNEVLELMDGSGNTPLHVLVKNQHYTLIPVVLARNPSLLHRENAVGTTPLEMCTTVYLRQYVDHPPSIPSGVLVPQRLENRSPISFVEGDGWKDALSDQENTRQICLEASGTQLGKRKLVSLSDANAVATRLASRNTRQIGMNRLMETSAISSQSGEYADEDTSDLGIDKLGAWYYWTAPRPTV